MPCLQRLSYANDLSAGAAGHGLGRLCQKARTVALASYRVFKGVRKTKHIDTSGDPPAASAVAR